jgi:hypothetical protein
MHGYHTYLAAALEPLAIEPMRISGFTYPIGDTETKLLVGSFASRVGAAGRLEQRDPREILPLRGVTVTGLAANAMAVFVDPALPQYPDAGVTHLDRLNTLATSPLKYLALTAPSTAYPLLPGPYGSILIQVTVFDLTWIAARPWSATVGSGVGFNLTNELGSNGANDYQRTSNVIRLPVSKNVMATVESGPEKSSGAGKGGILYYICGPEWGAVADPTTYLFRDDFMGSALDTGKWTRTQSTAGNVEIDTAFQWCRLQGNDTWGGNGAASQQGVARAGVVFTCDFYTGDGVNSGIANGRPNAVVGLTDGAGVSYTNFAHGLDFTDQSGARRLQVFENGVSRGTVGNSYSLRTIYRVRITCSATAANYEIQGGPEYAPLGGGTWTDITPAVSSSTTTPVHAGFTQYEPSVTYVGDVKIT